MKNSPVQIVLALIALTCGCAAEELLPKAMGVGFPVLLCLVQSAAVRREPLMAFLFAIAAGAAEDSISSLPMMTSVSYFLLVAALARWSEMPRSSIVPTYLIYQLWLCTWVPNLQGGIFARMLLALPIGLLTAFVVHGLVLWMERKAAIDEED